MICERTKRALDEKLVRIGQWRKGVNSFLKHEVLLKAAHSNRQRAIDNEHNRKATELILALVAAKVNYQQIAHRLNRTGFKTARGGHFQAIQVIRLANRLLNS